MPAHDVDEERIALRGPDGGGVAERPEQETGDPEPQAEAERGGQRAVEDRDRPRRAAEQDRFGQRAMDRRREAGNGLGVPSDQRSAAEREERQEEARRRERDRQAEHDLDQPPEAAGGVAEGERQTGDDDDDHRDDLGDRSFDRLQDLVERLLPRHVGAGGAGGVEAALKTMTAAAALSTAALKR